MNSLVFCFFIDPIEGVIGIDTTPELYILNGGFWRLMNTNMFSSCVITIFIYIRIILVFEAWASDISLSIPLPRINSGMIVAIKCRVHGHRTDHAHHRNINSKPWSWALSCCFFKALSVTTSKSPWPLFNECKSRIVSHCM